MHESKQDEAVDRTKKKKKAKYTDRNFNERLFGLFHSEISLYVSFHMFTSFVFLSVFTFFIFLMSHNWYPLPNVAHRRQGMITTSNKLGFLRALGMVKYDFETEQSYYKKIRKTENPKKEEGMAERQILLSIWDEPAGWQRAELVVQPGTFSSDGGDIRAWRGS